VGICLTVAMQAYDALTVSIRAWCDINRLDGLIRQYNDIKQCDPYIEEYLGCLKERIKYEKRGLAISLANFAVLLIAACLATPAAGVIFPLLPLIGAGMAVMITVINFEVRRWVTPVETDELKNLLKTEPVLENEPPLENDLPIVPLTLSVADPSAASLVPLNRCRSSGSRSAFFLQSTHNLRMSRSSSNPEFCSSPTTIAISHSSYAIDDLEFHMGGKII